MVLALDLFWLCIAVVGVVERQGRYFVLVLVTMWLAQRFMQANMGAAGEVGMIIADTVALTVLTIRVRKAFAAWAIVPVLLFAPSLAMQSLYWLAVIHGVDLAWPFFWGSAFIFTAQMVSAASPGGRRLGTAIVRYRRARRALRSRNFSRDHLDFAYAAKPL